jgi:hypothetical protein
MKKELPNPARCCFSSGFVSPQQLCDTPGRQRRHFCEECGLPVTGVAPCPKGMLHPTHEQPR